MNIQDHISESLETKLFGLKIFKFSDADLDPGSGIFLTWIRDPGWKNSNPGSGIKIPDPQHWFFGILCNKSDGV